MARMVAYVILYLLVFIIIVILTAIVSYVQKGKLTWKKVLAIAVISIPLSGISGILTSHITEFTKSAVDNMADKLETAFETQSDKEDTNLDKQIAVISGDTVILPEIAYIEENHTQVEQEDAPPDQASALNAVIYNDSTMSLAERVGIPDGSAFPGVDMEAISILERAGSGYQGQSRGSDSISAAFTADIDDTEGLFSELEEEILKNPYVGDMIVQGLVAYYKEQEWMQEFAEKAEEAFTFDENIHPRGLEIWYSAYRFSDGKIGIYVTDEYRLFAEELCLFLEKFDIKGIETKTSYEFYHSLLPIFYSDSRSELSNYVPLEVPALILADESKDFMIGFDLNDKGLIIY